MKSSYVFRCSPLERARGLKKDGRNWIPSGLPHPALHYKVLLRFLVRTSVRLWAP